MILVKEEFLTHEKTITAMRVAGPGVVVMWLAMKGYAARKLTNGFVPDAAIDNLPGAPRAARRLLKALVECGEIQADGTTGPGLVDVAPHGWVLHDYLDHANSAEEEGARRDRDRQRKALYRSLKRLSDVIGEPLEAIKKRIGNNPSQERVDGILDDLLSQRVPRDKWWDVPRTTAGHETGRVQGRAADSPSHTPAPGAEPRPRASQPNPAQPSPTTSERASAGSTGAHARAPGQRPIRRPDLLPVRISVIDYAPLDAHADYATELGLTVEQRDKALLDLRDKHGGKLHMPQWLDETYCSFLEAAARPRQLAQRTPSSQVRVMTPAQQRIDAQLERVRMLEEEERQAAGGSP